MKKKLWFCLLLAFSVVLSAEWIEITENRNLEVFDHETESIENTKVFFNLDGYEIQDILEGKEKFQKISYPNAGRTIEAGLPNLPQISRLIAIPNKGEVTLEILHYDVETISDIKVYPAQKLQSESQPIRHNFTIDQKFYASDEYFPNTIASVGTPAILRDYRIVSVTINPFQYNPQTEELKIYKNMEVQVRTEGRGGTNQKVHTSKKSRFFEEIYQSKILNYNSVNRREEYQIPAILFIYPNDNTVLSTLQYISDWKHQKGFDVTLASTIETGYNNSMIKNYIQDAYNNWENPPEFVVLVGDANGSYSVPTFYENWSGYGGEGDHPYSQMEGNDILADIFVGRLSFESYTELQTIAAKIIGYEKTPFMGNTSWYEKALMVGDPSTSGPSCVFTKQYIGEAIQNQYPYYSLVTAYNGSYSSAMSTETNNGVAYFNYRGYYGMSGFGNSNIYNLNNVSMLPFAVFLTCGTGSFASGESRSEAFIRAGQPSAPTGAIGAIGTATTGTHTTFNNAVDAGMFEGIFTYDIHHQGGAVNMGKLHLYECWPNNPGNKVDIFSFWNSLMGDPSVDLWTKTPQELDVVYNDEIPAGTNYFTVEVKNDVGFPVQDAWVTALQGDDEIFVSAHSDNSGMAYLPLDNDASGDFTLTVTKHDFIPHIATVSIIPMEHVAQIDDYQIDDDNTGSSSGNDDGYINPGETIEMRIAIENRGTQDLTGVTAILSCEDDYITINDNEEDFGSIPAGNSVFCSDDFDFTVDPDVVGGSEINLELQIEDDSGNSWQDYLTLPIEGINLYVSEYSVEADPNGIFDPGETVEIVTTLFNTGTLPAENIEGMLQCDNENITLIDSLGTFPTIFSNNTAGNDTDRFQVAANNDVIPGSQILFDLILSNSSGFYQEASFFIEVGIVSSNDPLGPDNYGYYIYDSEDINYDHAPEYDWIEISPNAGGNGTSIGLSDPGDTGDVQTINVPFIFSFYGIQYDEVSVCSNGWIAPGGSIQATFMNSPIPSAQGPSPMVAAFWDDLITTGGVWEYYDTEQHRFIIQWDVQTHFANSSEIFQIIIFDPAYYLTPTGDAEFQIQYKEVNNTSTGSYSGYYIEHGQYATVGLESHTGLDGLQYTYNNSYPTAANQLQDEFAIKITTRGASTLEPPVATFNATNFQFTLMPEQTGSDVLQLTNNGQANLIYSIIKDYEEETQRSKRGHGGPDNYGYQWFDSDEPNGPVYNWRDVSGLGNTVTFDHNDIATDPIPIGFDFIFYGTFYDEFIINPNGWIGFGDDCEEWNNLSLPHPDAPRPAILPFWDDLDPLQGGNVSYYSTSDSLVVWFDDVIHFPGNYNGTYDFQVILYPSGKILIQYREMEGTIDSATIGIQKDDYSDALQVTYNGNYVEDEFALEFKRIVEWLELSQYNGFVESGATENININVTSGDLLLGDYFCNLIVTTNDPDMQQTIIPVEMTIMNGFPAIEVSENELDFGTVFIGEDSTQVLTITNTGSEILEITNITNSNTDFAYNITTFELNAGESQNVNITFQPSAEGVIEDTLSIYCNDPNNQEYPVILVGTGQEQIGNDDLFIPLCTKLKGNYPNPFNPRTTISFDLRSSHPDLVDLSIYNIKGQKVKTLIQKNLDSGSYSLSWNGIDDRGKKVASGIYFYRLETTDYKKFKKMLLLK